MNADQDKRRESKQRKSAFTRVPLSPIAVAAAALLLLLGLAQQALAHAALIRSEPAANAVLDSAPAEVRLWLTEPLVPGLSAIRVLDSQGRDVQQAQATVAPTDPTAMAVALPPLPDGTYLVSWRALSSVDGHTTEGAFTFSIGVAGAAAPAGAAATPSSPWAIVLRWLLLLSQAGVVGSITFQWWVWQPSLGVAGSEPAAGRPASLRFLYISLALGAASATGLFASQVLTAAGGGLADLAAGRLPLGAIFASRLGTAWIGRIATLGGLAVIASDIVEQSSQPSQPGPGAWAWVVRYGSLWLSGLLLYFTTVSSHSAALAGGTWLSWPVVADWVHLAATAGWAGGLLQFLFVLPWGRRQPQDAPGREAWLRRIVVRYSTVAAFGVGLMLLSGLYLSAAHVGGWERLEDSEYGRALVVKLALVAPMLLLGAVNLFWVKPELSAEERGPSAQMGDQTQRSSAFVSVPHVRWFWRIVALEAAAGIAVLAAAGRLTELPRGADAGALGPGRLALAAQADDLRVALTLSPARQGPNQIEVALEPPASGAVSLRFVSLDRALGATEVLLEETGPGRYGATNGSFNLPGSWQIEAVVRRPDAYDAFARFDVSVRPDGRITAGDGASSLTQMLIPFAGLFGGLALVAGATGWLLIARRAAEGRLSYYALLALAVLAALAGGNSLRRFFAETTPGSLLTNPSQADALSLITGQTIYREKCLDCHGTEGAGDGPLAAGLTPRSPGPFASGRAARAQEGDLYWWIKNGVAGSAMPAFRSVLSDDQVWNTVNYLKTLGAGAAVQAETGTAVALPPTPTPPGGPLPEPGESEAEAIALLDQVEGAMASLAYLREEQTIVDDIGQTLTFNYQYAAPDRLSYYSAGQEVVVIGSAQYFRFGDGEWQTSQGARPFAFPPTHGYTQNAVGARYEGAGALDGRPVEIVSFADSSLPAAYRLWVDKETKRILQLAMEAPNHHMISRYDGFDVPAEIEAPIP